VSIKVGASVPTNGQFYEPNNVDTSVSSMVTGLTTTQRPIQSYERQF
jgi:hypothetical protein